jgi:hypothetical protein
VVADELALPMQDMNKKMSGPKEDVGHAQGQPARKNAADTLLLFGSSRESGLTSANAATRLRRDGPNDVPPKNPIPS